MGDWWTSGPLGTLGRVVQQGAGDAERCLGEAVHGTEHAFHGAMEAAGGVVRIVTEGAAAKLQAGERTVERLARRGGAELRHVEAVLGQAAGQRRAPPGQQATAPARHGSGTTPRGFEPATRVPTRLSPAQRPHPTPRAPERPPPVQGGGGGEDLFKHFAGHVWDSFAGNLLREDARVMADAARHPLELLAPVREAEAQLAVLPQSFKGVSAWKGVLSSPDPLRAYGEEIARRYHASSLGQRLDALGRGDRGTVADAAGDLTGVLLQGALLHRVAGAGGEVGPTEGLVPPDAQNTPPGTLDPPRSRRAVLPQGEEPVALTLGSDGIYRRAGETGGSEPRSEPRPQRPSVLSSDPSAPGGLVVSRETGRPGLGTRGGVGSGTLREAVEKRPAVTLPHRAPAPRGAAGIQAFDVPGADHPLRRDQVWGGALAPEPGTVRTVGPIPAPGGLPPFAEVSAPAEPRMSTEPPPRPTNAGRQPGAPVSGTILFSPGQRLPSQANLIYGSDHAASALRSELVPRAVPDAPSSDPGWITELSETTPGWIVRAEAVRKRGDFRLQATASVPLWKPLPISVTGGVMAGISTVTELAKNWNLAWQAIPTALGGQMTSMDWRLIRALVNKGLGYVVPTQMRGAARDLASAELLGFPIGLEDTLRWRLPSLKSAALASLGHPTAPQGIGLDWDRIGVRYERQGPASNDPRLGDPDRIVGHLRVQAPLTLQAEAADLPPGQQDALGSTSRGQHYRLRGDLAIDDLGHLGSVPFLYLQYDLEYSRTAAEVVIPRGAYLPWEFVANLSARLNGTTAAFSIPVRASDMAAGNPETPADLLRRICRQPGRLPRPEDVTLSSPSFRGLSPAGVAFSEDWLRLQAHFSHPNEAVHRVYRLADVVLRQATFGRIRLGNSAVAPRAVPGVPSVVGALLDERNFAPQQQHLVILSVGFSPLSAPLPPWVPGVFRSLPKVLPSPLTEFVGHFLPTAKVSAKSYKFAEVNNPPRSVRDNRMRAITVWSNGRFGRARDPFARVQEGAIPRRGSDRWAGRAEVPDWVERPLTREVSTVPAGGKEQLARWLGGLSPEPGSAASQAVARFRAEAMPLLENGKHVPAAAREALRDLVRALVR